MNPLESHLLFWPLVIGIAVVGTWAALTILALARRFEDWIRADDALPPAPPVNGGEHVESGNA